MTDEELTAIESRIDAVTSIAEPWERAAIFAAITPLLIAEVRKLRYRVAELELDLETARYDLMGEDL